MSKKEEKITISKEKVLEMKEKLEGMLDERKVKKGKGAFKKAFGILEGEFDERNSSEYVRNLRKEWRE